MTWDNWGSDLSEPKVQMPESGLLMARLEAVHDCAACSAISAPMPAHERGDNDMCSSACRKPHASLNVM